ncbi:nuclease-related domain-containing protein [Aquibacillus sediminis]|uniref:nuclease-related domain-containing protein n=1 Tax=Aquibacillus sediminis TaxID=2574734 RepID=UPI001109C0AD|nr:nuclease-related domain-containing protein [Aquibacillus sediminis]
MILKDLERPIRLKKIGALLPRLSTNHKQRQLIEEDYAKLSTGYRGEKEIFRHLKRLEDEKFLILHNLRLKQGDSFFQIDFLVIHPRFLINIESKNINGTLFFDKNFDQMIRSNNNDVETGFRNPLSQITYQKQQLKQWLISNNLPALPIHNFVGISNPSTIIKSNANDPTIYQTVVHAENLLEHIAALEKRYPIISNSHSQFEELGKEILENHTPEQLDILSYYKLNKNDISTGVQCPACQFIPMERAYGSWKCPSCSNVDRHAHKQAIHDFLLILNSTISNTQCREFLHISSRDTAYHLLSSMNLHSEGSTKIRRYMNHN